MNNCDLNNKNNDLKEEYKLIQQKISSWDGYSLSIKNWAITVWAAIVVFIGTQYYTQNANDIDLKGLFLIPLLLPFPFWLFDGLFKFFQRMAITRGFAIEDYLNKRIAETSPKEENRLKKIINKFNKNLKEEMKTTLAKETAKFYNTFPIYDPVSRTSKSFLFFKGKYSRKTNFLACFLVRMVMTVYCVLISFSILIIGIITNNYMFLFWLIAPIALIIIAWILSTKGII